MITILIWVIKVEIPNFITLLNIPKLILKLVGLIVGIINNEDKKSYDFEAPKRGRVSELVVSSEIRSHGIGRSLLDKMEEYFKSVGCKVILIEVFAYNERAYKFYSRNGYFDRSLEMMKKI